MKKGVTIQDIADALKLSRNTVSKALNGKYVPVRTRNAVLNATGVAVNSLPLSPQKLVEEFAKGGLIGHV